MPTHASSSACTNTFTDRHIHGVAGVDFATSPVAEIREALALLASRRTTRVTASLPSLSLDAFGTVCERLKVLYAEGLLQGAHVEGPFIATDYAGAHPPHVLHVPNSKTGQNFLKKVVEQQADSPLVTMMTVAPELPGFVELAKQLVDHGIQPALGHTGASYDQFRDAIDLIAELTDKPVVITHLYNAMRGFHHRDPGPILAVVEAAEADQVIIELIADGHHVHFGLIRWWFDHYPESIRLVSDASAATGIAGHAPMSPRHPRLGHQLLQHHPEHGPRLAEGHTIASGSQDLLAIHDGLVAAGFDHELVCAAMR